MKSEHPIRHLCDCFEVSPSGYYDWRRRQTQPGARELEDEGLRQQISSIYQQSEQRYGSPRIQHALKQQGARHGRNRIARLMREEGLAGRQKKRFRVRTTDSNHDLPIAPNLLAQAAVPKGPNELWAGDITYIETEEGWVYLASILDLYSRRIVGWAMSSKNDTELVLRAWKMAVAHRQPPQELIFHSDRGVQYAAREFRAALREHQAVASMSRKANCYDNATMESFWSTLKVELVYRRTFQTRQEAEAEIFRYIETFYNRWRLHSSLGYRSPLDYENQNN